MRIGEPHANGTRSDKRKAREEREAATVEARMLAEYDAAAAEMLRQADAIREHNKPLPSTLTEAAAISAAEATLRDRLRQQQEEASSRL